MSNQFGIYDPIQYAQLAIQALHKQLGMATRVYRGYDKQPQQRGSTISIPIPSVFTAQDAPGTDQDISTDSVSVVLNRWKEVKFAVSDKEFSYTQQQMIDTHITPAAYAIADAIDKDLASLAKQVPWLTGTAGNTPASVGSITGARRTLFNNQVQLQPGKIHLMIDGNAEEAFLQLPAFAQNQGAGDRGVETQLTGSLGTKYNMEIFANQNVIVNVPGALTAATAVTTQNAVAKTGSIVNFVGTALTGTIKTGDIIQFAGDPQNYTVANPAGVNDDTTYTANGNALAGVSIFPHLKKDLAANTAVTFIQTGGVRNLAFHENFATLAMAPLTDKPNEMGAQVATVTDPVTGIALRSRMWYDGDISTMKVGLDVLYGFRILDANLAVNLLG